MTTHAPSGAAVDRGSPEPEFVAAPLPCIDDDEVRIRAQVEWEEAGDKLPQAESPTDACALSCSCPHVADNEVGIGAEGAREEAGDKLQHTESPTDACALSCSFSHVADGGLPLYELQGEEYDWFDEPCAEAQAPSLAEPAMAVQSADTLSGAGVAPAGTVGCSEGLESPSVESCDAVKSFAQVELPPVESPAAESADAESTDAKSAAAESTDAKSADAEFADAKSADAESANTESPAAESAAAKSTAVQSADAESSATECTKFASANSAVGESPPAKSTAAESTDAVRPLADAESSAAECTKSASANSTAAESTDAKSAAAAKSASDNSTGCESCEEVVPVTAQCNECGKICASCAQRHSAMKLLQFHKVHSLADLSKSCPQASGLAQSPAAECTRAEAPTAKSAPAFVLNPSFQHDIEKHWGAICDNFFKQLEAFPAVLRELEPHRSSPPLAYTIKNAPEDVLVFLYRHKGKRLYCHDQNTVGSMTTEYDWPIVFQGRPMYMSAVLEYCETLAPVLPRTAKASRKHKAAGIVSPPPPPPTPPAAKASQKHEAGEGFASAVPAARKRKRQSEGPPCMQAATHYAFVDPNIVEGKRNRKPFLQGVVHK